MTCLTEHLATMDARQEREDEVDRRVTEAKRVLAAFPWNAGPQMADRQARDDWTARIIGWLMEEERLHHLLLGAFSPDGPPLLKAAVETAIVGLVEDDLDTEILKAQMGFDL